MAMATHHLPTQSYLLGMLTGQPLPTAVLIESLLYLYTCD